MNGPDQHSAFIHLPGIGNTFIDGIPDECQHDSKGDLVMQAASGKMIYWHTYRKWAHLTTQARRYLIFAYHNEIEDPIVLETTSCSKCKKVFHPPIFQK